jgi:acyl-CoA synthetase (AMP-forming)/AMP-acid ligase II/acyl carrier protein
MPTNSDTVYIAPEPTISTVSGLIRSHAERTPDAIAIMAPGRQSLTYSGLLQHLDSTVETLNGMGIGRGDVVALLLHNGPEAATAFLATAACSISAPLNPGYREKEFEYYMSDLRPKALIILEDDDSPARTVANARGIQVVELTVDAGAAAGTFNLVGGKSGRAKRPGVAEPGELAVVVHTSGTTSAPKLVPLTQSNICSSAHHVTDALALAGSDRCLCMMPMFHLNALVGTILSSIASGSSIICASRFDSALFPGWMEDFHPTWYSGSPTIHQAVLDLARDNPQMVANSSLRLIRSSTSALPTRVIADLGAAYNTLVIESYGMTEASYLIASNPLPPGKRKPGSVGIASGSVVAIMSDDGELLPRGETGEIVIKGPNVMEGYLDNPEANAESFVNGWLRTGDQGYLDNDGYLFINGRLKEIIIRGGQNVTPREVDDVLLQHPAVAHAVTFSVPHPTLGEDIAAAVVLNRFASASEQEIRALAFEQLADYKVPSQILIVDDLPKGPTGKLLRIGLAETFESRLAAAYVAPRNGVEEAMAGFWCEVIGIERAGINDNFFLVGGDSLMAARVVARIQAAFNVDLPLESIFRRPTVAEQADEVRELILQKIETLSDEEASQLLKSMM